MALTAGASAVVACGGPATDDGAPGAAGGSMFHATVEPLAGFNYDTGLLPKVSPAQVQLKVSAGGALTLDAAFAAAKTGLTGTPGGGKLALDIHLKMDGTLKVDTPVKKYDGDLPGLADIDFPIRSEVAFDPFLLGDGEKIDAKADIPETALPPIPLGSVPGKLHLTIATGSYLSTSAHGSCVSVSGGSATYASVVTTSGKLIVKGKITLEVPSPFNKSFDLPVIEVPVPAIPATLTSAPVAVSGVDDGKVGACDGASSPGGPGTGSDGGAATDGGTGSDGATTSPPSTFSVVIDGKAATAGAAMRSTSSGAESAHLYFTAPGLGPNANLFVQAGKIGTGCVADNHAGAWLEPDDGSGLFLLVTPLDASCGLTVTQVTPRFKGTFKGAVEASDHTKHHTIDAVFDIAP